MEFKTETTIWDDVSRRPIKIRYFIFGRITVKRVAHNLLQALNPVSNAEHKNYLRFLWYQDIFKENPAIIIYRFLRVVLGVTSSPFLLNATIRHHCEKYLSVNRLFIGHFLRDLYLTDLISGADSVTNGFIFYKEAKNIMLEAGVTLRKWVSSNLELQQLINKDEGVYPGVTLADVNEFSYTDYQFFSKSSDNGCKKVLGVN